MDALIERDRKRWLERALADRTTDRLNAARAIRRLYSVAGLPQPRVLWTDSPSAGAIASQRLLDGARADPAAAEELGPIVLQSVVGAVQAGLRAEIAGQLKQAQVHALDLHLHGWLEARLGQIRRFLLGRALAEIGGGGRRRVSPGQLAIEPQAWDQPYLCAYGFLDTPWIAVADVARSMGVVYPEKLADALRQLRRLTMVGWWWPYESVVVVSDRPSRMRVDERFAFHSESGPALVQGKMSVFIWHGLAVNPEGLDPDQPLSLNRILRERDPDLQRLLVNHYGVERFRRDAHAVPVDHDRYGTLWRIRLPDGDALQMVEVINSTPEPDGTHRRYNIRVPPQIRSPIEAVAWTFGLTADEYRTRLRAQT